MNTANKYFLWQAECCAHYLDNPTFKEHFSQGWFDSTEQQMWYMLLLAAQNGEI